MDKHTPGPWKAFYHSNTLSVHYGNEQIGGHDCIVHWMGFKASNVPMRAKRANAALIARAPDLLRENERLREALLQCVSCMPMNDPMYTRQLEAAWNAARAALKESPC